MHLTVFAGFLAAALLAAPPVLAAGKFNVIELSYVSRSGKPLVLHFMPPGGFSLKACKASLPSAIAGLGTDLAKAFKKNYGTDMPEWSGMKFVKGSCAAFDIPPGQLLKLKLS